MFCSRYVEGSGSGGVSNRLVGGSLLINEACDRELVLITDSLFAYKLRRKLEAVNISVPCRLDAGSQDVDDDWGLARTPELVIPENVLTAPVESAVKFSNAFLSF